MVLTGVLSVVFDDVKFVYMTSNNDFVILQFTVWLSKFNFGLANFHKD